MLDATPSKMEAKQAVVTMSAFLFDYFFANNAAPKITSSPDDDTPKLLSRKEAAKRLSISVRSLDTLASAGKLQRSYIGKKDVRFLREEIDRFAETLPKSKPTD